MNIRQKIILYFSSVTIVLISIFFFFIYTLFAEYREEEFQKRLKDNTMTTLRFLAEVQENDRDVLQALDRFTIHNLYQEQVLLFDEHKKLIYSGIDDTRILYSKDILNELSAEVPWVETQEDGFDVVGAYLPFEEKSYYGITKAYDTFGYSKLLYLRNVLILTFFVMAGIVILISYYLSQQISRPLTRMAMEIAAVKLDSEDATITIPDSRDEINFLGRQFNQLMTRLKEAFSFQKHAIQHISHELKTPIAILVSNFERMEKESDPEKLRQYIASQKEDTRNLSNIINALLEISKTESGHAMAMKDRVRIDDLLFDLINEVNVIQDDFHFEVVMEANISDEQDLTVVGNKRLLTSAFLNLMMNCIQYSSEPKAMIGLSKSQNTVGITFRNQGSVILPRERQFMFQHFFRGVNSKGKRGFGLGLVLVQKVVSLHHGKIVYSSEGENTNIFNVALPLS